ncbi:MAG: SPASM domain-containing protein [Acidobacteriota bacterium]
MTALQTVPEIRPRQIRLEASSACQLRCPSCPTTSKATLPVIGRGWLTVDNFRKLVDDNPWVEEIELSNYGEMFLNPQLPQIMEYAHQRGLVLTCDNGANFNHVSEEAVEALVKFRFRSITCSIDGASLDTYGLYRVRGDFNRVVANIRRINSYKEQYQSQLPFLTWQFVVFGHNEHELPAARQLARELGIAFYAKLSWDSVFSPIRDEEAVKRDLGLDAATREEFREKHGVGYLDDICTQMWDAPQINWDGKVLGCCRNHWGEFGGNALTDGLLQSINSERMRYARQMLLGKAPARPDVPCTTCDVYIDRRRTGNWVPINFLPREAE